MNIFIHVYPERPRQKSQWFLEWSMWRIPYYQWAKFGPWTSSVRIYIHMYWYLCWRPFLEFKTHFGKQGNLGNEYYTIDVFFSPGVSINPCGFIRVQLFRCCPGFCIKMVSLASTSAILLDGALYVTQHWAEIQPLGGVAQIPNPAPFRWQNSWLEHTHTHCHETNPFILYSTYIYNI